MVYKKLAVATLAALGLQMGTCLAGQDQQRHGTEHWGYEGETGAAHWSSLAEDNALCGSGKQQAPIDITESIKAELPPLEFNYSPIPLIIENNGHSIQITADKAGSLKIGDNAYQLLQFHSHTPSEEAINGIRADMVIHLVHQNIHGQLAVVAVLLNVGDTPNPLIETLRTVGLPKKIGRASCRERV